MASTDKAGNITSVTHGYTVIGAKVLKEKAVDLLVGALGSDPGDDDLADALGFLFLSLRDNTGAQTVAGMGGSEVVWIDSLHIDTVKGQDVFQYEQQAVDKLIAYLEKDENAGTGVAPVIPDVMEKLQVADRLLAIVAISESVCGAESIAVAGQLVAEADSYWATGDPATQADNTYDMLQKAWEKATGC